MRQSQRHNTSAPACAPLVRPSQTQAPAVLDYSRALAQYDGNAMPAFTRRAVGSECNLVVLDTGNMLHDAFAVRCPSINAEGKVSSQLAHLRPLLPPLLRTSRNSLGPLRSRRLRRCRSSSVADGSDGLFPGPPLPALSGPCRCARQPRWALGPCSVAMTDLHALQTMSAASWSLLSFAFITSNIIGCVLLQVGHQTRENRASTSMF